MPGRQTVTSREWEKNHYLIENVAGLENNNKKNPLNGITNVNTMIMQFVYILLPLSALHFHLSIHRENCLNTTYMSLFPFQFSLHLFNNIMLSNSFPFVHLHLMPNPIQAHPIPFHPFNTHQLILCICISFRFSADVIF